MLVDVLEKRGATQNAYAVDAGAQQHPPLENVAASSLMDDPYEEQQDEYRRKMGRWRQQVWSTVQQPVFWLVVDISARSRAPLDHHHNFMRARYGPSEGGHVAQLVCGKSQEIGAEFSDMFANDRWAIEVSDAAPVMLRDSLLELGVELLAHYSAAYNQRIAKPLQQPGPWNRADRAVQFFRF